jgi:TolB protein
MRKMTGNRIYFGVAKLARARSSMLGFVLVAGLLAAVGPLMLVYAQPAGATFPGTPGRIAYANFGGPDSEIYTIRPDGGGRYQVTNNRVRQSSEYADDTDPAYSPSGNRIAYTYWDDDGHKVLYTIKASGEDRRKVIARSTGNGFDSIIRPAYAPSGQRIAYTGYDGNFNQIFTLNVDGGSLLNVTKITSYAEADSGGPNVRGGPDYSPDGQRIAYTGWDGNDLEIFTIRVDGGGIRQLTHNDVVDLHPSYSPNGNRIAYAGGKVWFGPGPSDNEIYTIEDDGGGKRRLTDDDKGQGNPSYSPNGDRIAYNSNQDGDQEIYTMKVGGGDKRQLTHNTTADVKPSWGSR